jgi:hypothetical protein
MPENVNQINNLTGSDEAVDLPIWLSLQEGKKAYPIGTIAVWDTGTYQKVTHGQISPGSKKPNDWKKLTTKVKLLNPDDPKAIFPPGSALPQELQQFLV